MLRIYYSTHPIKSPSSLSYKQTQPNRRRNLTSASTIYNEHRKKQEGGGEAEEEIENKEMSNKSPIFPIPEPQHFSDYGFDPQIDYFQLMEEARKHKREASTKSMVDSLHFKLQKPISKDGSSRKTTHQNKSKKKRWWKNALLICKWKKWVHVTGSPIKSDPIFGDDGEEEEDVHRARARAFRASISGPVYMTESRSGSSTPRRSISRPSSGPLAGTLTPCRRGDLEIPYLSLRELNREHQQRQRISASPMPIYLVT